MSASSIVFAGIVPHPPIMVPEVGREAIAEVRGSIDAMRDFTERIIASGAQSVIIISPHAPLDARAFVAYHEKNLYGDFANFRAPDASVDAPLDEALLNAVTSACAEENYEVMGLSGFQLDHGTAVPLYFLQRNGWTGSVVALGYSFLSNEDHVRFGNCIKRAVDAVGRPVAFVASGDLSHRLRTDAPAGYNPQAHLFDEEVVSSLRDCKPSRIVEMDQKLRKLAGECGYRSMLVCIGATEGIESACEVLSYEAPFGVGYMVAQLVRAQTKERGDENKQAEKIDEEDAHVDEAVEASEGREAQGSEQAYGAELPALARRTIETFVREGVVIEKPETDDNPLLDQRAACFVSIKTLDGDLRGCIGTIEPTQETLAEELIANSISAATRDPRFPPVASHELSNLRYSVDVLHAPEPARFEELDPKSYGVIVEDEAGLYRGLLLPDLPGVETVEQQVEIAARKAGIRQSTPLKLSRFRVERFREPARSN
ncbi:MAG: AmmeMemoRadiSam system protein A [Pyrinomonadaceae bacterium]